MEAFFIAVSLEMGTRPGPRPEHYTTPMDTAWQRMVHLNDVKEFMQAHPGAPPVFSKLKRMHHEVAGGLKYKVDEEFFWSLMLEAYVRWCASQPVD